MPKTAPKTQGTLPTTSISAIPKESSASDQNQWKQKPRQVEQKTEFLAHSSNEFELQSQYCLKVHQWIQSVTKFIQQESLIPQNDASLSDVIETVLLQCLLRLMPNLGHHVDGIRAQIVSFLLDLALIFNPNLDKTYVLLQVAKVQNVHLCADVLFTCIGASLNVLSVTLVAGLEGQYLHPKTEVRDMAICISTRLIFENSTTFVQQDNLAAVWNLHFLLDMLSSSTFHRATKSRLPICNSLKILSSVYVCKPSLTEQIASRLLFLPDKSTNECTGIMDALSELFTVVTRQNATPNAPKINMFDVFTRALTAHNEHHYDLLFWAADLYTSCLRATFLSPPNINKDVSLPTEVTEFYSSLANHLRASPSLIRYGAAMLLSAVLTHFPALLNASVDDRLFSTIVSGCFDEHRLTGRLYLALLESTATSMSLPALAAACNACLALMASTSPSDDAHSLPQPANSAISGSSLTVAAPTQALIGLATAAGPVPPWSFLLSLLASLEHAQLAARLAQLELIAHWCRRQPSLNLPFVQTLMPWLKDDEPAVQTAVVEIFRALSATLPEISDHLFLGVANFFFARLSIESDRRLPRLLSAMSALPYERLPAPRLHETLDFLQVKVLHRSPSVRQAV
jgi:hypothetical protein